LRRCWRSWGADGEFEAVGEFGEDATDLVDEWVCLQWQAASPRRLILDPRLPEALGLEPEERVFGRVLVVVEHGHLGHI